ncbi:hypothetical protein DPMN_031557, partial [Dreissena polymorpha]
MANFVFIFAFFATIVNPSEVHSFQSFGKYLNIAKHLKSKDVSDGIHTLKVNLGNAADHLPSLMKSAVDEMKSEHQRRRRQIDNKIPITHTFSFNDSHSQMVIHWAGDSSGVIISLTKGALVVGNPSLHTSDVFISYDYGKTFESKRDYLKLYGQSYALISQFISNPVYRSHYFFVDEANSFIFSTRDYGRTFSATHVSFKPNTIRFHKDNYQYALAMDETPDKRNLYMTSDFGLNWQLVASRVKTFYWEDDRYGTNKTCVYIHRTTNDLVGSVTRTCSFFNSWEETLLSQVHDFEVQGPYMFAIRNLRLLGAKEDTHQFFVSYYRGDFQMAQFDHSLKNLDYFVADATEDQIFLCVNHGEGSTHLYVSDVNSTQFSLSLDDVLYFHPNGSNKDSWLRIYMDEPFADLHKVEGMRGVYIATQLIDKTLSQDHQRTLITYDAGGEWQLIEAPQSNSYGQNVNCSLNNNCSLHLTQLFDRLYAGSRTTPLVSSDSAPGIIIGSGNVGSKIHVDESVGIFLSTDAGFSWNQVLLGKHLFNLADHGALLVAVKSGDVTNSIVYSTDNGETWKEYSFSSDKMLVHGLLTEPGEKTTQLFMFASDPPPKPHSWKVISLNMSTVFSYPCSDNDYKDWSLPDNTALKGCLLGRKLVIRRRIPRTNCYNGEDFVHVTSTSNCACTREDFECDYGYKPMSGTYNKLLVSCVFDNDSSVDPSPKQPRPCPAGTFYPVSRGYRKVYGDTCVGGEDQIYAPLQYACRVEELPEVLIYSTRTSINRIVLPASRSSRPNVLLGPSVAKNVSAIAYEYSENGYLYWADNQLKNIQRLCEDGTHTVEVLHNTSLSEISSLGYDWKGQNLYWIDRGDQVLEVSRRDGKFRRELIKHYSLVNAHSLQLDPAHGKMYWVSGNKVIQCWMDGTNNSLTVIYTVVLGDPIRAITVNSQAGKVYSFYGTSNLAQTNMDNFVTQRLPWNVTYFDVDSFTSMAVYKGNLILATGNALKQCTETNCLSPMVIGSNIFGITDIMVLDTLSQNGLNNSCTNNGGCAELCLLKPSTNPTASNPLSHTCRCSTNTTLAVYAASEDEMCCPQGFIKNSTGHCAASSSCGANNFTCANGRCVSLTWKCDGQNDCGDFSDEINCPKATCADGYFSCSSRQCLPMRWKCDHDNDCGDFSDELNCPRGSCHSEQFQCGDGRCISKSWMCDNDADCSDRSDERNCTAITCLESEYKCPSGIPHCILQDNVCDGFNNCANGADELHCNSTVCPSFQFKCINDSKCVYFSWKCDGDFDCPDHSDEMNCTASTSSGPYTIATTTKTTRVCEFRCSSRDLCVPLSFHCDGIDDCGDNSDEIDCPSQKCGPGDFQCKNNRCIPMNQRCNNRNDCSDWSDELYCSFTTPSPPRSCLLGQFTCAQSGNQCIPHPKVCDGNQDCRMGEDEMNCNASCNNTLLFSCGNGMCIPYILTCDGTIQCRSGIDENLPICPYLLDTRYTVNAFLSSSNCTVRWTPYPNPTAYILSYAFKLQNKWQQLNVTLNNTNSTSYLITLLKPATTYYITVFVLSNSLTKKYASIERTTADGIPEKPSQLYITIPSDSDYPPVDVIIWPPKVTNGLIVGYNVCLVDFRGISICEYEPSTKHTFTTFGDKPLKAMQIYYVK